jgi:CRP/FNR family transcriptional regulator
MRAVYGLKTLDNCLACPVREEHLFCNISPSALQRLNEITSTAVYPKSAVLFIEGQQPRGVFVLCTGKAFHVTLCFTFLTITKSRCGWSSSSA